MQDATPTNNNQQSSFNHTISNTRDYASRVFSWCQTTSQTPTHENCATAQNTQTQSLPQPSKDRYSSCHSNYATPVTRSTNHIHPHLELPPSTTQYLHHDAIHHEQPANAKHAHSHAVSHTKTTTTTQNQTHHTRSKSAKIDFRD